MKFQHPGYLFFLFFLIVPIIIHLYSFRQYKTYYFSSIVFLKNIDQETKSVRKLKHLLILISRLLAILFLVLTFCQPFIPLKNKSQQNTGNVICIYIDNSFSMSQLGTEGQLLSQAKEQAKKIINQAPLGSRILLFTNELSAVEEQFTTKTNLLNRLDKIKIQSISIPISKVIDRIQDIVTNHKEISIKNSKQYIYLSDFQKNNIIEKVKIKDKNQSYFYPFQLVPQSKENVAIDSVWFNEPVFKVKVNNELHVKVSNYGEEDCTNLELILDINKTKRTVFVDLKSAESKEIVINYSDYQTGIKQGKIHINDKHLDFDDDYYFTYEVLPYSSILLIDGDDAHPAVNQVYSLDKYYHLSEVKYGSFLPADLKNKHLVVLNGVKEINQGLAISLKTFKQNGGSLLLFPSKEADLSSWNSFLSGIGISNLGKFEKSNLEIEKPIFESPFYKGIFEQKPKNIPLPKVKGYYSIKNNINSSILLLQNKKPLWLKQNSSFLYASLLDSSNSTIVSNSLFPVILLRIAELSQRKIEISHQLGSENRIQIYPSQSLKTENKLVSTYHLKNESFDLIPYSEEINNETYISLVGLNQHHGLKQGIYRLESDNYKSDIALNYSREESNVNILNSDEINTLFQGVDTKNLNYTSIESGTEILKVDLEKPQEFWRIFLLLALIFVLTEMALTRFMK
jgi:hypothetical protein